MANTPAQREERRLKEISRREELHDTYVRYCIKKLPGYDGHAITAEEIAQQRAQIIARRTGASATRQCTDCPASMPLYSKLDTCRPCRRMRDVLQLTDNYVRYAISKTAGFMPGQPISAEAIAAKREQIAAHRIAPRKPTGIRTANMRTYFMLYSRKQREDLTDTYIRRLLSFAKGYDGQPITQAQINEARARIIDKRARKITNAS